MDAAMVTAVAALIGAPLAAAAAVYGSRVSGRAQREGGALTVFDSYNTKLINDRDRAEQKQALAEARLDSVEEELATALAEIARLRAEVVRLGGVP